AHHLLSAFMQYFSRLLAGVFFLYDLIDHSNLKNLIYKYCRVYKHKCDEMCCTPNGQIFDRRLTAGTRRLNLRKPPFAARRLGLYPRRSAKLHVSL
ncbi:MAG: hypothetical protein WEK74_11595, partial [Hydrogenophaga sp.]